MHITTGMSYAYTTDLMGEWHYGENGFGDDVIQDNHGHYLRDANGEMQLTDLETMCANNDSNHGGVVKANGNWYVFGHINTSNGCRQGIAEKIELVYTEDGKLLIGATEETSSGMADNLDAYEIWDAGIACYRTPAKSVKATGYLGNHGAKEPVEIDFDVTHYAPMKGLVDGAVLGYKYLDFGSEAAKTGLNVLLRQEEGYTDGTIEVYLDAPTAEEGGTKIGTVTVSAAAIEAAEKTEVGTDGNVWSWLSAEMEQAVSGEHGVYFVFHAETEATTICLLDQFQFVETKHPLAITTQPTTFAGQVGDTASFTVAANRSDVTYQWMYSQNGGFNWIKSTMPGADTATLSVEFKAFRENQMYKVVVTDSEGNTVESIPVALTKAVSQVVILKNPVDQTGSIGSTATFSVKAEGEGLTYQWMYSRNGGSSWLKSTADGANTATLSIQVKAFRNGQMYKCIVTDANGVVVESASATMNMK